MNVYGAATPTPALAKSARRVNVVIILLTLNQRTKTLNCLQSLMPFMHAQYRVLLWDNGSTDGTTDAVRDAYPHVLIHRHATNLGVASGRNAAAALAMDAFQPRYLFFMDNDMTVSLPFLESLVAPFAVDACLAQTTGKIMDYNDLGRIYGAGGCHVHFWLGNTMHVGHGEVDRGQYDSPRRCIPSGGCMLVRADVFAELGGFDPIFDPYGPEDLDFGLRAIKSGYYGLYVPSAIVYHDSTPGYGIDGQAYTTRYTVNKTRHWLTLMRRHAPVNQRAAFYIVGAPFLLIRLLLRQSRRGNLGPVLRGLMASLRPIRVDNARQ